MYIKIGTYSCFTMGANSETENRFDGDKTPPCTSLATSLREDGEREC